MVPMYGQGHQLPVVVAEFVGTAAELSVGVTVGTAVELSVGASVGAAVGTVVGTTVGTAFEGTVFSNFVNRFISERADLRIKSE